MVKTPEFERMLKRSLHYAAKAADEGALEKTASLARVEADRRHRRERITFCRFLFKQLGYIGWKLWGVQGLLLLLFEGISIQLYEEKFWNSPASAARLLLCVSVMIAMMSLPLIYRSVRYRMQEVEGAAYFSSAKLLLAKLAALGIGDLMLLTGVFLAARARSTLQLDGILFYLCMPFLMISAAYMFMLVRLKGSRFFAGSIAIGAAMLIMAIVFPWRWLLLLCQCTAMGRLLICGSLLVFCAGQVRKLAHCSSYAQLQTT